MSLLKELARNFNTCIYTPKLYNTENESYAMYMLKDENNNFVKGFDDIFTAKEWLMKKYNGCSIYYKEGNELYLKVFDFETVK